MTLQKEFAYYPSSKTHAAVARRLGHWAKLAAIGETGTAAPQSPPIRELQHRVNAVSGQGSASIHPASAGQKEPQEAIP